MQKVSIDNLGPVKNFTMNINKFNILIGEQATGKSTIGKCIYFFRTFKSKIIEYLYLLAFDNKTNSDKKFPNTLNANMKDIFIKLFGYSWGLDDKLKMKYNFTDDENIIDGDFNEIQTELIDEVSDEINTKYTKILYCK